MKCVELAVCCSVPCTAVSGLRTALQHDVSLSTQQFVVTHTLRQTEAPLITRQYGHKHTFCQNVVSTTNCLSLYFCINVTSLSAGQMTIGPVTGVSGTAVYRWATAHCCAMSEVLHVVTVVYWWATAYCCAMSEVIHVVTVV